MKKATTLKGAGFHSDREFDVPISGCGTFDRRVLWRVTGAAPYLSRARCDAGADTRPANRLGSGTLTELPASSDGDFPRARDVETMAGVVAIQHSEMIGILVDGVEVIAVGLVVVVVRYQSDGQRGSQFESQ
jgi:hypothetical protein